MNADFVIKNTDTGVEVTPQSDKAKEWVWEEFGHGAASFTITPNTEEYWTEVKLAQFTVEFSK